MDAHQGVVADELGIEPGMVVQGRNWGRDTARFLGGLRAAVTERSGGDLLDESADEIVDVVLLCWRAGDGDLVDALMDAAGNLADCGVIWVLIPHRSQGGHDEAEELAESVPTAGLVQAASVGLGDGWSATGLTWPSWRRTRPLRSSREPCPGVVGNGLTDAGEADGEGGSPTGGQVQGG